MKIQTKGALFFEIVKIKNAVQQQDSEAIRRYYDEYLNELSAPSREIFHAGCFTIYSEKISFHLLSTYLLLDYIDFHFDGKKFIKEVMEDKPRLLTILSADKVRSFSAKPLIHEALYDMQRITKHRLHVFLLPLEYQQTFSLEITYPGNALIIFPQKEKDDTLNAVFHGVAEFYYRKQLKELLPPWADSFAHFQEEFVKWANNIPSKFNARKMNDL